MGSTSAPGSISEAPVEYCDLVMKGGITSGVVYPLAITELSKKYFFKNIGGTSAGALAAAITAAAEFGRRSGNQSSYDLLAGLPKQLGTNNLLLNLFQPSTAAVRVFRVVLAALKAKSIPGRILKATGALVYQFYGWTVLGILAGSLVPVGLFLIYGGSLVVYVVLGLLWVAVISAIIVFIAAAIDALKATTANGFGFCSGFDQDSETGPPLTNWLHEQIQRAAGKDLAAPLTFGDLWKAPLLPGEPVVNPPTIKLQVVTTNLTLRCPFTVPFEAYAFYFDEAEFRKLFPAPVVQHLLDHSPNKPGETITSRNGTRLYRLPDGENLPIVVAARISLSFPLLLSAIPLYFPDHAHKLVMDEAETTDALAPSKSDIPVRADRCWFSDGGVCSNFPMHFFDSPLPRWPTFGIDLEPRQGSRPKTNAEMVWFPPRPGSGSRLTLNDFEQGSPREQVVGFFGAIVNTMQNWRDNLQAIAAGYRERIVHIQLSPDEGGLNLNMAPETIANLSERGQIAGQKILQQFDFSSHIFVRYRITMSALQTYLNSLSDAWSQPVPQDEAGNAYVNGTQIPPHYRARSVPLAQEMFDGLLQLVALAKRWKAQLKPAQDFGRDGAPRPQPILRNQPKF